MARYLRSIALLWLHWNDLAAPWMRPTAAGRRFAEAITVRTKPNHFFWPPFAYANLPLWASVLIVQEEDTRGVISSGSFVWQLWAKAWVKYVRMAGICAPILLRFFQKSAKFTGCFGFQRGSLASREDLCCVLCFSLPPGSFCSSPLSTVSRTPKKTKRDLSLQVLHLSWHESDEWFDVWS